MKRSFSKRELPHSALKYVLEALIPYSEANLKLSFMPNAFFNDLENIDKQKQFSDRRYKRQTLKNAFYKARKADLVAFDETGIPRLTHKGKQKIRPYKPKKLDSSAQLMIVFDIPELHKHKRQHLRLLLKELGFRMVQKSVWVSPYDHRDYIAEEVKAYELEDYVQVYECARIK